MLVRMEVCQATRGVKTEKNVNKRTQEEIFTL